MNIEEKAESILNEFKVKMAKVAEDAIADVYSEMLPHAEQDTYMNVAYRSESLIKNLLSGSFKKKGDSSITIDDDNGISVDFSMTDSMYDSIRDNLVKVMPACPKDLKIKSLELTIEHMQKHSQY